VAKLSTKKLNISDYSKNNQTDIANLARSLNPFMDDMERILRKGLSVEDNLPFQYITINVEVDSSSNVKTPLKITTSLTTTIKGCIVISASASNSYPTAAPFIAFTAINGILEIKKVIGIPANTKFELIILVVS
jgi:hypothetical protein